jgi:outer membrane protein insertion porin family
MGIRRAFKKGIFLDLKAHSEPYNGGIKLIYIATEIPVINKISFIGNEYIWKREIRDRFFFKEGEDYMEDFFDKARNGLVESYRKKGFPDAEIEFNVENYDRSKVNLIINIREGDPVIIKSIDVLSEVRSVMKTVEYAVYDQDILNEDMKKIASYYKKRRFLSPEIGPFRFNDGKLVIPINSGPKLQVLFVGNKAVSSRKLRKKMLFIEEREVSDETVAEAVNRIKDLYESLGYYYVGIAASVERDQEIKVSFFINEGDRVYLNKIIFEGTSVSDKALVQVLSMRQGKQYDDSQLTEGREALISFYNSLGYISMKIVDVKKEFINDGRNLNLHFIINEGFQVTIDTIEIAGNKSIDTDEIIKAMRIKGDAPYNLVDIGNARLSVMSLYRRRGYADVTVKIESTIKGDSASLKFQITENQPYVIGKIILQGNRKTKAKIIRREFTFIEGDSYNYDELLKVKQRLYRLGIFNEVSIDTVSSGINVEGKSVSDIVVSLKEGNAGAVEFSAGLGDYEGFRGMIDISYRNLGGYNREIGFKTKKSSKVERYLFYFREPWFLNKPNIPLKVSLIKEDSRAINTDTRDLLYKIDKLGLLIGVEKAMSNKLKLNLDYEYSITETTDVDEGVILSKEDVGTLGISSISPSLHYDTRDNPFNPVSGSFNSIVLKIASKAFLSEIGFIKTTFKSSWFFQLYKDIVFAFSLGGGTAFSFEGTKELPLIERYFLGGGTTVRGFENDMLGPKGQNDSPTGGNIFALLNSEIRWPLGKGFGLVTFVDSGNVWETIDDINNRDLRYSAGGGLRYKTPVGPVRIDYGHKISRKENESAGEVHFSFGHAF